MIAFVGSVFSPWYARARRRSGTARAENHCALNVSLYGGTRRWTMTERGTRHVVRTPDTFAIGPSVVRREGDTLVFRIDERGCPIPRRVQGEVRVTPLALTGAAFALDPASRHRWRPVSPRADVEVTFGSPRVRWRGHGYLDSNAGDEPLEHAFRRWNWCRAVIGDRTAILYDRVLADGAEAPLAIEVDAAGRVSPLDVPAPASLAATRWRVARSTRTDAGGTARVVSTFQDSPFYARSLIRTRIGGEDATAMHETLDLARFGAPSTQAMLPFRVPRRA